MIDITYANIGEKLPKGVMKYWLDKLPTELEKKVLKLRFERDQRASLLGYALLIRQLEQNGYSVKELSHISYNDQGKPSLSRIDDSYNIAHSGQYVICAFFKEALHLGIDIEVEKEIDFRDVERTMSEQQWQAIQDAANPQKEFFRYWAIKESVIKADGRGLAIPLVDIEVRGEEVCYGDEVWFIKEFSFVPGYGACISFKEKKVVSGANEVLFY